MILPLQVSAASTVHLDSIFVVPQHYVVSFIFSIVSTPLLVHPSLSSQWYQSKLWQRIILHVILYPSAIM